MNRTNGARRTVILLTALLGGAALGAGGCALTTKADAIAIRYFTPPASAPTELAAAQPGDGAKAEAVELRLGRVRAADHLRETIVFQKSDVEIGAYDAEYWTERPTDYVERSLRAELYKKHGLTESLSTTAVTLDVDVLAFQEVRKGEARAARVTLGFTLHDRGTVTDASQVSVDIPSATNDLEGVVAAMGKALDQAAALVAERIAGEVGRMAEKETEKKAAKNE